MELCLVQYSPIWENKKENKAKLDNLLSEKISSTETSKLIIYPELTLTGFTMKSSQFAEDLKSESMEYFSHKAVKYNSYIAAGIIEKEDNNFYNTMLVISPEGELLTRYRKIHPFSYSTEDKYYSKGTEPVTAEIGEWKTGLTICYDLRFPELFRKYGKQRTELIINIANWPVTRIEHWRTLLKARAIENQCYVAGVNRCGNDPKLQYNGQSAVFDPMGNLVSEFTDEEKVITAVLNKTMVSETRNKFPFLQDISLI